MKKPSDNQPFIQEVNDLINSSRLWMESTKPHQKLMAKLASEMGKVVEGLEPFESFQGVQPKVIKIARSKVGLSHGVQLIAGNSFGYKRRRLRGLTHKSKPGKLFKLLLTQPNNFVPDTLSLRLLKLEDSRDLSFVMRDLKKALASNGLKLVVKKRETPAGYLLINIQELHPKQG